MSVRVIWSLCVCMVGFGLDLPMCTLVSGDYIPISYITK